MSNNKGITTVVMAGGKSSRMGTDKAFIPLLGKPLIDHVLESLSGIGQEEIIITVSVRIAAGQARTELISSRLSSSGVTTSRQLRVALSPG